MRRLLLDTHALLWWLADDPRLGAHTRALIEDGRNVVMVSSVSAWEISINKALGKLEAPDDLDGLVEGEGFEKLSITMARRLVNCHPCTAIPSIGCWSHRLRLKGSTSLPGTG